MNRRTLVFADGALPRLVSIGDVNAWELVGEEQEVHYLHESLYGRG